MQKIELSIDLLCELIKGREVRLDVFNQTISVLAPANEEEKQKINMLIRALSWEWTLLGPRLGND